MTAKAGVHAKGSFSLADMLSTVKASLDFCKVGAIALFIGVVRGATREGETVRKLELEAYEEKADKALNRICEELQKRKGIVNVQIHHLLGEFNVGEELVYVLVAGAHRNQVFPVLEEAVERYKKEAPIFKKEYVIDRGGAEKSYWVGEREKHWDEKV